MNLNEYDEHWSVGHVRQYVTTDSIHIGCMLYIKLLKEWGLGIVLRVDKDQDRVRIHWQKLNIIKYHNTSTLLHYINQDYDENKKKDYNRSFMIER